MTRSRELVRDPRAYQELRDRAAQLFSLGARLPGDVLASEDMPLVFIGEGDNLLGPSSLRLVGAVAMAHGDAAISYLTVDAPIVGDHGTAWCSARMDMPVASEDFEEALQFPHTIGSGVACMFGPSLRWGIWAQRDLELAVVAGTALDDVDKVLWSDCWMIDCRAELDRYLEWLVCVAGRRPRSVADEVTGTLVATYSARLQSLSEGE